MKYHLTRHRLVTAAVSSLVAVSATASVVVASTTAGMSGGFDARTTTLNNKSPELLPLPGPGHFVRHVTNRYLPWKPDTRWIYQGFGSEGGERTVVKVLDRTRDIEGITATVVRDIVRSNSGRLIERTFDWYGQDGRGRVWYLGENSHAYERGRVSTEGSWETGVDGAKPGVVMFAHPQLNVTYWQEFYGGQAEDQGRLLERSTKAAVASGRYSHVRMTEDTSPLEPQVAEFKFYAPRVGVVLELNASPEQGRVELVRMVTP